MKIICAPDSFKESLSALDAAHAMRCGIERACPGATVDVCPIADGGEGTVQAMIAATAGQLHHTDVPGPLGQPMHAEWGMLGDGTTAVIELAAASGLALVPPAQRDAMHATTLGTGQLIRAALDANAQRIILGIGGSATNDVACGAAQALGVRFIDGQGNLIEHPLAGGDLDQIQRIDLSHRDPRLNDIELIVACDVRNPLTGPDGAAHIFGPQKGATPEQVRQLDANHAHLASLMQTIGHDVAHVPGAGAAGGFGAGAMALLGGELRPGAGLVLDAVGFDERVAGCDLCLSGEGKLDGQSLSGKAVMAVAQRAREQGVPTVALVGVAGPDVQRALDAGLAGYEAIGQGLEPAESMARAAELLEATAGRVVQQRHQPG